MDDTKTTDRSVTFTQEDVDRVVRDRLNREKAKYTDFETFKTKAEKLDQIELENLGEIERLTKIAADAEESATAREVVADNKLIEAAVLAAAAKSNAVRPEHLFKLLETGSVTIGDDGQVAGAEEAVVEFLKQNPEYVGDTNRKIPSVDQGARSEEGGVADQLSREDLSIMSPDAIESARQEGRLASILGNK